MESVSLFALFIMIEKKEKKFWITLQVALDPDVLNSPRPLTALYCPINNVPILQSSLRSWREVHEACEY
mgnify:CR=1 FL=1